MIDNYRRKEVGKHGRFEIYLGNSEDILPTIPVFQDAVCICSPPYNMRLSQRNGKYVARKGNDSFAHKYDHFDDDLPIEEYFRLHDLVLENLLRICHTSFVNIAVVTGSKEAWFQLMGKYCKQLKDMFIWDKGFGQPASSEAVINRAAELIFAFERDSIGGRKFTHSTFERGTLSDILRFGRGGNGDVKGHGAVFPFELPCLFINNWSKPDDVVIDPFLGTGTTGRAAVHLGRKFIGIEQSEDYFNLSLEKLQEEEDGWFAKNELMNRLKGIDVEFPEMKI